MYYLVISCMHHRFSKSGPLTCLCLAKAYIFLAKCLCLAAPEGNLQSDVSKVQQETTQLHPKGGILCSSSAARKVQLS